MKTQGEDGKLLGNMIQSPTPFGGHFNYPAALAQDAVQRQKYSVFHTTCSATGTACLVITQPDRIRVRLGGDVLKIATIYEEIPWKEHTISDNNGVFHYKQAPSLNELESYMNRIAQQFAGE